MSHDLLVEWNAVDGATARAIAPAVHRLESDDTLSVGIIARTPGFIVRELPDWSVAKASEQQREIAMLVFESKDAEEGARTFTERCPAQWSHT